MFWLVRREMVVVVPRMFKEGCLDGVTFGGRRKIPFGGRVREFWDISH